MTRTFDLSQLIGRLGAASAPELLPPFRVQVYEQVESTNRVVWEAIAQGAPAGTVAIALQQTAGRGQWGRQWSSPLGGLYLSVALRPALSAETSGQLTLAVVCGVANALRDRQIPVGIKWPNDLVIDGKKLGGILTETRIHHGQINSAVVGIGLNWENPIPSHGITLKSVLNPHSSLCIESLEALAAIVLNGLRQGYAIWQTQGIEAVLPTYHQMLINLGQPINYQNQSAVVAGVSSSGDLQLQIDSVSPSIKTVQPGQLSLGYTVKPG